MPKPNAKAQLEDQQNDVLPEPDDDIDLAQPQDDQGDRGGQDDPQPQPQNRQPQQQEDRLASVTALYRQMRDAAKGKTAAPAPADHDPGSDNDNDDVDEGESLRAQQRDNPPPNRQEPPPGQNNAPSTEGNDPLQTIKVDGVELRLPLSQVIALAQRNLAGENRLEEAKRILDDVKALRGQIDPAHQRTSSEQGQQQSQAPSQTDPASTQQPTNQLDDLGIEREKLKQIVERIQIGDTEEGVDALAEVLRLARPSLDESAVMRLARQAYFQTQTENEITSALDRFKAAYEPVVTDPYIKVATLARLTEEIVADLRNAGFREEDLAAHRTDLNTLGHWLNYARAQGRQVRSYDKLLSDVGDFIADKFKIDLSQYRQQHQQTGSRQTNQQPSADELSRQRLERKRLLPSQPRSANIREQMPAPRRPKTATEVVLEMKRQRGFA